MLLVLIAIGFFVISFAILIFVFFKRHESSKSNNAAYLTLLTELQRDVHGLKSDFQTQVQDLSERVHEQLHNNSKHIQESQRGFHQTVGQVQDRLGQLHQASSQMMAMGKDILSLQDILKAPKLRGGLGELLLGDLLRQILPEEHFALQHSFKNGTIVDAVIFLAGGSIPVDAKFPLENFRRLLEADNEDQQKASKKLFVSDVKKHVDAIASKYILPEEGTFDFALMYIPAENIYYETIIKDGSQESLSSYALQNRVIPVSPNSFYAYLKAIARGLKGLRIEKSARQILEKLGELETDFKKCLVEFEKTGTHISNAYAAYDRTIKKFGKFEVKLSSIEDLHKESIAENKTSSLPKP